jgi:hypothetical protein
MCICLLLILSPRVSSNIIEMLAIIRRCRMQLCIVVPSMQSYLEQ